MLIMEQKIQYAIETIDSAREHKCELEGRRKQLSSAISQVTSTANITRHEVEHYFELMKENMSCAIGSRLKALLKEIDHIELEALDPLKDCQLLIEEGIEEAASVVTSGESILNEDIETDEGFCHVSKFISMTDSLALDSLPEVPSATEVPSISAVFSSDFVETISKAVKNEGVISRRSPVQITDLSPIPGGVIATWACTEEEDDYLTNAKVKYLFRLQSFRGKIISNKGKPTKERNIFKEIYCGPEMSCTVKNLVANSIYTFRVSRCQYTESGSISRQWSPWSVYQEKMTVMPGFTWMPPKDEESYILSEKNQVALKKSGLVRVLYSDASSFVVGYPISFKIDLEGKARNKCDCIGLCMKRDPDATGMHTKEGTICMMADGHIWFNGVRSHTKFPKLSRGLVVSFCLQKSEEKQSDSKHKITTFRAALTIGEYQAVFDWIPVKSGTFNPQNLAFCMLFQSSGWKVSIV
ncbi:unnamed protein product [Clavelina lepadiformis]|uniref:Fibronectin type-III domain-containing protein n=1 Tax=Clavelina lepadiformis TaxID=159417 RepID=A0ABP0GKN2_CLALP